jgi:hypothetical protein
MRERKIRAKVVLGWGKSPLGEREWPDERDRMVG